MTRMMDAPPQACSLYMAHGNSLRICVDLKEVVMLFQHDQPCPGVQGSTDWVKFDTVHVVGQVVLLPKFQE